MVCSAVTFLFADVGFLKVEDGGGNPGQLTDGVEDGVHVLKTVEQQAVASFGKDFIAFFFGEWAIKDVMA